MYIAYGYLLIEDHAIHTLVHKSWAAESFCQTSKLYWDISSKWDSLQFLLGNLVATKAPLLPGPNVVIFAAYTDISINIPGYRPGHRVHPDQVREYIQTMSQSTSRPSHRVHPDQLSALQGGTVITGVQCCECVVLCGVV